MIATAPIPIRNFEEPFHRSEEFSPKSLDRSTRWNPVIDIYEDASDFKVLFEIPGIAPGDLSIEATPAQLIVRGTKKPAREGDCTLCNRIESSCGNFERSVSFPTEIHVEKVNASYHNGLLTVCLPKKTASAFKSIKIAFNN